VEAVQRSAGSRYPRRLLSTYARHRKGRRRKSWKSTLMYHETG
jgi:hypothetical protein